MSALGGLLEPFRRLTLAHVSLFVSPVFTTLVTTRRCRCLLRSDYM